WAKPESHSAKTLNFFVATSALRLLAAKLKDFAFPSGDAVIAHCSLGLRSGGLRGAVFHNPRSLQRDQFSLDARQAAGICSTEHENTLSTILGDTLPQTPQSPATTRIETVAESLTQLRAILETIRDNAQRA